VFPYRYALTVNGVPLGMVIVILASRVVLTSIRFTYLPQIPANNKLALANAAIHRIHGEEQGTERPTAEAKDTAVLVIRKIAIMILAVLFLPLLWTL
jgi:hypothetical protein